MVKGKSREGKIQTQETLFTAVNLHVPARVMGHREKQQARTPGCDVTHEMLFVSVCQQQGIALVWLCHMFSRRAACPGDAGSVDRKSVV